LKEELSQLNAQDRNNEGQLKNTIEDTYTLEALLREMITHSRGNQYRETSRVFYIPTYPEY